MNSNDYESVPKGSVFTYMNGGPLSDIVNFKGENRADLALRLAAAIVLIEDDYPGFIGNVLMTASAVMNGYSYRRKSSKDLSERIDAYQKELLELMLSDEILDHI